MKLPFEDESFDIVINEAMLTMLPVEAKKKAIAEYFRVLKPNGLLLTHDVMLVGNDHQTILENMRKAINVTVTPLTKDGWKGIFQESGFRNVDTFSGEMTLLSPKGMIYDEGIFGTLKIIRNAMKAENREQFKKCSKPLMILNINYILLLYVVKNNIKMNRTLICTLMSKLICLVLGCRSFILIYLYDS